MIQENMIHNIKRHTDNRLSMPGMGGVKTQVMMLLLLMAAGVGGNVGTDFRLIIWSFQ